ncbi:hypothetical protein GH714_004194 [Hevea brasiliensis]|uniref:Uncharacterized protein n=1 Tax=Hevea brasiliensis TaxID=3981 RepID=A0A6A6L0I1_HEVBR|nr:hypothetical protein GH714_004194 [Hevea brasiliensis]
MLKSKRLVSGKRFVKPSKRLKEIDVGRVLSKFITQCNEVKAATIANKEGGQLSVKAPQYCQGTTRTCWCCKEIDLGDGAEA